MFSSSLSALCILALSSSALAATASFGTCSTPQIKFAAGLDGRKETSFQAVDQKSYNHGSTDDIDTTANFICQQVQTSCKGNSAAVSQCKSAVTAADKAAKGTGAQADAFNAAFGQKTNFANVAVVNSNGQTVSSGSNSGSNSGTNTQDPQSATTLDPAVIATGFALDGQQVPAAGQVASLTSKNNFINFCLTVNKPITNGQQIKTGSCNPAPMGVIAATTNMPSSKFQFPKNGDTIKANQEFTIQMAINNLAAGNFVNAASNYYSAPQQVDSSGNIIGHSHVVIEQLSSLDQTSTTDPNKFAFFKGINGAAVNGVLTADVTSGLPAGTYRMSSINAAANHQPVLVAVAQHGSLDDMVYFTVTN
ncbi:uncharacterized protein FOMMEDRAFT_166709 [Fomitiporia mediterranea MF3/22]|uniref:uncharacterized protein n=1 Tax=Fomitiporia mediterranea (strain MF3/22) TaxID=694068 RepID=UPI000440888B|nr:uncharacterized protein FOMMEDRAFT_166709 [Fomitiporia mediterranea MF3/22]EJD04998.1 hypothetical protein FOMMEDRAFT_166709 [Fomitiporia mediterranea MF3/22]